MGFNNSTYSRNRIGSAPSVAALDTADLKRPPSARTFLRLA